MGAVCNSIRVSPPYRGEEERMNDKPCCSAEALRRVKQIEVEGKTVGIVWLEPIMKDVAALDLATDGQVVAELMKRVKIYNYVPQSVEKAYAPAVFGEYKNYIQKNRQGKDKGAR